MKNLRSWQCDHFVICYLGSSRSSRSPRPSRPSWEPWYFCSNGCQRSSSIRTSWTTWTGWSPWSTSEFLYSYLKITKQVKKIITDVLRIFLITFSVDRVFLCKKIMLNCKNCDKLWNTDCLYIPCLLLSGATWSSRFTRSTRIQRREGEDTQIDAEYFLQVINKTWCYFCLEIWKCHFMVTNGWLPLLKLTWL